MFPFKKLFLLFFILNAYFRFERSQSEDHRPSIWQKFKSFEDGDRPAAVRRSTVSGQINGHPAYAGNNPHQGQYQPEVRSTGVEARFGMAEQRPFPLPQSGTLPRPQATVKPLPAPSPPNTTYEDYYPSAPQKLAFSSGYQHNGATTVTQQHGTEVVTAVDVHYSGGNSGHVQQQYQQHQENFQLPEVKKPDFSSLEDDGNDIFFNTHNEFYIALFQRLSKYVQFEYMLHIYLILHIVLYYFP